MPDNLFSDPLRTTDDAPTLAPAPVPLAGAHLPDVPGYATFISPYPQYRSLPAPVQVAGKGCTKVSATGGTTPVAVSRSRPM